MSKLTGYLIVAGAWPLLASGQDVLTRERLQRDRARLQVEADRAREGRAALDELRDIRKRLALATDTMVIAGGNITVLATREMSAVTRAAARQADSVLSQIAGSLGQVRGSLVLVRRDTSGSMYREDKAPRAVVEFLPPNSRNPSRSDSKVDVEEIARQIEGTASARAAILARTPILLWRRGNLPLRKSDRDITPDWGIVRFDLLESPSLLGPRCYRGDIVACSMALGLTPVEDPVMAWYDSTTRISTVKLYRQRAMRFDARNTEDCLKGDDAACGRALRTIVTYTEPPAGSFSRDALFWEAMHMGGDGAIERLMAAKTGTASEAIAAVAKAPTDSVVRVWQRHVREGSLGSDDLTFAIGLVALGWVGLMLFVSTRISRWR